MFLNSQTIFFIKEHHQSPSSYISGSLTAAIVMALALATIGANASEKMTRNNFCNNRCNNNLCRDIANNTAIPSLAGCNQYFVCINGHAVPQTCPDGQLFNLMTGDCEVSGNLHCLVNNFECPPDGIHFFPHEEYCDKYFICSAGYALLYC